MKRFLLNFAKSKKGLNFEWGITDCHILTFEAIDTMFYTKFAELIKETYNSYESAIQAHTVFGKNMEEFLKENNFYEVPINFEQLGDILIVDGVSWQMCHVSLGDGKVMSVNIGGKVEFIPLSLIDPYKILRRDY